MTLAPVPDTWERRLAVRFAHRFPRRDAGHRRLGREGEHPVVHPDGTAADIAVLWPHLAAGGGRLLTEGDLVVGLEDTHVTFSAEVGRGTIEIIVGPEDDLHGLRGRYEAAMERLLAAADAEGLFVLGYGIQPGTPPNRDLMAPKRRYGVLLDVLGDDWLSFAVTASDQVHVDVTLDEVVDATDLGNLLAPLSVALCANSPVLGGRVLGVCSGRELLMGRIGAEGHRHGMPEGPSGDLEHWVGRTFDLPYLMHRAGDRLERRGEPFRAWLEAAEEAGIDDDAALDAWLWHEHYVWNSARPRVAHGTVELRAPCQQPWPEHFAAAALGAGVIAGHRAIAELLARRLDDPWAAMRAWHPRAVREGLNAEEPVPGLLGEVLQLAAEALEARGRGEEALLAPLFRRLETRRNPAQEALAVFEAGGLPALVERARVR